MKTIRFAVIGMGNIGKRHAHHIIQHPNASLVAVCDIDPNQYKPFLSGSIEGFSHIDDLFAKSNIDVLNVCTPNYLHHSHSVDALTKGVHVVCEKPMALSEEECDAMIQAAEQHQKTIFVVKQNRYNEPVQRVKELIQSGGLGKILMVNVNCFWNRNEQYYAESPWRGGISTDGGCLFTQFSHFVDIMYYLLGNVTPLCGKINNYLHPYIGIEDTGSFVLQSNEGAIVNFNYSTCSYQKNMEGAITLLGEKGTVKIGGQYLNTIEYQLIENQILAPVLIQAKANDYGLYQGSMSNHDKVIDNVVYTLNGLDEVKTNASEGKNVVKIIQAMYQCARM